MVADTIGYEIEKAAKNFHPTSPREGFQLGATWFINKHLQPLVDFVATHYKKEEHEDSYTYKHMTLMERPLSYEEVLENYFEMVNANK